MSTFAEPLAAWEAELLNTRKTDPDTKDTEGDANEVDNSKATEPAIEYRFTIIGISSIDPFESINWQRVKAPDIVTAVSMFAAVFPGYEITHVSREKYYANTTNEVYP